MSVLVGLRGGRGEEHPAVAVSAGGRPYRRGLAVAVPRRPPDRGESALAASPAAARSGLTGACRGIDGGSRLRTTGGRAAFPDSWARTLGGGPGAGCR